MTCGTCGEKHKKCGCNRNFPGAVIEINNPEEIITLLRKVVIPASMGTEEQVPAAIGKYRNVVLYYEANKHTYIYSSDGIPTLLEVEIPQELFDRIERLEEEDVIIHKEIDDESEAREQADILLQKNIDDVAQDLEDFKNSPDVVDIVPDYAALQNYDTTDLSDKDIVRVLADETHDDASTFYRWDKPNNQWVFIGITGPYYTKSETDTLLDAKQDKLIEGNAIKIHDNVISAMVYPEDFFLEGESVSGCGNVVELPKTAHLKPKKIELCGETSQDYLTGNNLLYWPFNGTIEGSLPFVTTPDGQVRVSNATVSGQGGKFYLYKRSEDSYDFPTLSGTYNTGRNVSWDSGSIRPNIVIEDANGLHSVLMTSAATITIDIPAKPENIYIEIPDGETGSVNFTSIPMIVPSSLFRAPYEYFVGNEPSPSPDYPQEVKVVTGEQVIEATGVNLYNYADLQRATSGASADSDGYITFTFDNTGSQVSRGSVYYTYDLPLKEDTTYAIIVEILAVSGEGSFRVVNSSALPTAYTQFVDSIYIDFTTVQPGQVIVGHAKTKDTFTSNGIGLGTNATFAPGQAGSITVRISVWADNSITPEKFEYEEFVGQIHDINLGKNLFDKTDYNQLVGTFSLGDTIQSTSSGRDVILYMPCDAMSQYVILDQSSIGVNRIISTTEELPDIGVDVSQYGNSSSTGVTIFTPLRAKYIVLYYHTSVGVAIQDVMSDILDTLSIAKGSRLSDYSGYFTPIRLRRIGDKRDRIYRNLFTWYSHVETDELVLDGSENDWVYNSANSTATIPKPASWATDDFLCSHFRKGDATTEDNTFTINSNYIVFKSEDKITSLQDWKDWLSDNNITVYGQLSTAVTSEITNLTLIAELTKMLNIVPFENYTLYATAPAGDERAVLDIEAYKNSLAGITAAIRNIPICC